MTMTEWITNMTPRERDQFRSAFRQQLIDTRQHLAEWHHPGRLARVRKIHQAYGRRRR